MNKKIFRVCLIYFFMVFCLSVCTVCFYNLLSTDEIMRHEATHQQIAEEFGATACGNISINYVKNGFGGVIKGTTYYSDWCLSNETRNELLYAQAVNEVVGNQTFPLMESVLFGAFLICLTLIQTSFIILLEGKKNETK